MPEYSAKQPPGMEPAHPGAILREDVLPALNLTVAETARQLGISRQMLHSILAERSAVSPEMAVRLGRFCGKRLRPDRTLYQKERIPSPRSARQSRGRETKGRLALWNLALVAHPGAVLL